MLNSLKLASAILATTVLVGCGGDRDYSGAYLGTQGSGCGDATGTKPLITVKASGVEGSQNYYAYVHEMFAPMMPLKSNKATVSDDGSLTFVFEQSGGSGVFSAKPSVEVTVTLDGHDDEHVMITQWHISMTHPTNPNLGSEGDMVKDETLVFNGRKVENKMYQASGKDGMCMRKKSTI